jgi:hypothetical protein
MTRILFLLLALLPLKGLSQETAIVFPTAGNNAGIYCETSTTWNGTSWSNGEPASDKDVIFSGSFTQAGGTLNACSLYIQDNAVVNFAGNASAVIKHNVNVQAGSSLVFESSATLVQIENTQNNGTVIIKRNSSKVKKDEFTLWSSPVHGTQTLLDFSPETLINRFYTYSTLENIYNTVASPDATTFTNAKGYLIRTPEDHPETPTVWEGEFEGTPNTGNITIPMAYASAVKGYNAVGNPYASPISVTRFLAANGSTIEGAIWLWRKTDDAGKSSYCTVTKLGYQSNTSAADAAENDLVADPFLLNPEGVINTGQGFIVKAKNTQDLVFNNSMRMSINTNHFFRTNEDADDSETLEASRIWLNVVNDNNVFSQTLIGYTTEGTLGYDSGLDGESLLDGGVTLYTYTDTKKLAIQARPEFDDADQVALGFKTQAAGTFEITLDHLDGLFDGDQDIYVVDNQTGAIQNLKDGNYSFTSEAGTFESRFKIVYTATLGTETPALDPKGIVVYQASKQVKVQSSLEIESVVVYDMLGRVVCQQDNIDALDFTSSDITAVNQVVIVNITLSNNQVVSKKIVIN